MKAIQYISKNGSHKRTRLFKTENMLNRKIETFRNLGIQILNVVSREDLLILEGPFSKDVALVTPFNLARVQPAQVY